MSDLERPGARGLLYSEFRLSSHITQLLSCDITNRSKLLWGKHNVFLTGVGIAALKLRFHMCSSHGLQCTNGPSCSVGMRVSVVTVLQGAVVPIWGTLEQLLDKYAMQLNKGTASHEDSTSAGNVAR